MTTPTFHRYVALGDSFTEGVGDPDPERPNGLRGWADRVAERLAQGNPEFAYANLAVRGKLVRQIVAQQLEPALALDPDLVTIAAGGNDVIRPGTDPDEIGRIFEQAISRLAAPGRTVVVFTGVDVGWSSVFGRIRGKVAVYNENVRAVAAKYGALVADQWGYRVIQDARYWAEDRLHLNPLGHEALAKLVLDTLGAPVEEPLTEPGPVRTRSLREAIVEETAWTKDYAVPWVIRRIKHVSSGDNVDPKRPTLESI